MTSRQWRAPLLPILALAVLTLALTWPTLPRLATHVVDRQDPLLNSWIMAWEAHQLLHDPGALFQANIFYPYDTSLAFSEILLSTTALILPLRWAGASPLVAYNVAFLLSFFLTALGGYLLALAWTGRRAAALVGAVAFAFSPYRMGHLSQVQLLAAGWLPLALLTLDWLLRGRGPWRRNALLFTLFFLLQALASFYLALFAAVACLLYAAGWLLFFRHLRREAVVAGLLAAFVVALVLLPLASPYFRVQRELGAGWTLADNETFSASLQAYLYAPAGTHLWGALTRSLSYIYGPCCPPDSLFPGVTLLLLAGVALVAGRGRRRWLLLALLLVAFLLSLGPRLQLRPGEPTAIVLPYGWLFDHLPGFNALRAPVRWASLVSLALSLLAAWGLARFRAPAAPAVALALVLLEFAAVPLRLVPAPDAPPVVAWLAAQPPTRIVELPLAAMLPPADLPAGPLWPEPEAGPRRAWETSRLLERQFFSTAHWHSTPDGYSGYVPPRHGDFAREMAAFPTARSVALLQGMGIEYVVLHAADLGAARMAEIEAALPSLPALSVATTLPGATVLRVAAPVPRPDPALALLPTAPLAAGKPATIWLEARAGLPVAIPATRRLVLSLRWVDAEDRPLGPPMRATATLPLLVDQVAVVPIEIAAPAGPGDYRLLAEAGDARWHSETTVRVVAEAAPAPLPLPVRLVEALAPARAAPGSEIAPLLRWEAMQPLPRYFSLSMRLVAADGRVVAQQDGAPGGLLGTLDWLPGVVHSQSWPLVIPAAAEPGRYELHTLWYDPESGQPTWLWSAAGWRERLMVATIEIEP